MAEADLCPEVVVVEDVEPPVVIVDDGVVGTDVLDMDGAVFDGVFGEDGVGVEGEEQG